MTSVSSVTSAFYFQIEGFWVQIPARYTSHCNNMGCLVRLKIIYEQYTITEGKQGTFSSFSLNSYISEPLLECSVLYMESYKICWILTSGLHTPLTQYKYHNMVGGLIKLTWGVCKGLPCYAASPEKLFSFLEKTIMGLPYKICSFFSLPHEVCWSVAYQE